MLTPKNIHTRNFTKRQKIPAARKFDNPPPPPPRNFSNGPSRSVAEIQAGFISNQYLFRAVVQIMVRAHNDQF